MSDALSLAPAVGIAGTAIALVAAATIAWQLSPRAR